MKIERFGDYSASNTCIVLPDAKGILAPPRDSDALPDRVRKIGTGGKDRVADRFLGWCRR